MATPAQLRLQDQINRLTGRQSTLQQRLSDTGNVSAARRLLQVSSRLGKKQLRSQAGVPLEGFTPVESDLTRRIGMLAGRQSQLQALQSQGIGGDAFQRMLANRLGRVQQRLGTNQANLQQIQGIAATPPPPTPPNAPTTGTAPPTPTTPQTGNLADLLSQYAIPQAPGAEAAQNFYTQGLSRLNALQTPSFEDQFARWRDVANREADRQAAAITESFGSRGARYGSDLLQAQGQFRNQMAQNLATQADTINQGLNQQRLQELGTLGGLSAQQQAMENQRQQQALAYLFSDFARRTGLPPGLAAGAQYFSSFGAPTNIVGVGSGGG